MRDEWKVSEAVVERKVGEAVDILVASSADAETREIRLAFYTRQVGRYKALLELYKQAIAHEMVVELNDSSRVRGKIDTDMGVERETGREHLGN